MKWRDLRMSNELPRVRVVNPNDGWLGTECYIDENKIDRVKRIDFSVGVKKSRHSHLKQWGFQI